MTPANATSVHTTKEYRDENNIKGNEASFGCAIIA